MIKRFIWNWLNLKRLMLKSVVSKPFRSIVFSDKKKKKEDFTADEYLAYWRKIYEANASSGPGSYGREANEKASVINDFVTENNIKTVVELGCGDGNQLSYLNIKKYIGLDISIDAVEICRERFKNDASKSFLCYDPMEYDVNTLPFIPEMALSLDVIYHLVVDEYYEKYMEHLFSVSSKYVAIYAIDLENKYSGGHVRHRKFSDWILKNHPTAELIQYIDSSNFKGLKYPFYMYRK